MVIVLCCITIELCTRVFDEPEGVVLGEGGHFLRGLFTHVCETAEGDAAAVHHQLWQLHAEFGAHLRTMSTFNWKGYWTLHWGSSRWRWRGTIKMAFLGLFGSWWRSVNIKKKILRELWLQHTNGQYRARKFSAGKTAVFSPQCFCSFGEYFFYSRFICTFNLCRFKLFTVIYVVPIFWGHNIILQFCV